MLATLVIFWLGLLISLPPRPSAWLVFASGLPILACLSWRASRRRHVAWAAELRETADVHLLGLVLLYALGVQLADTHGVTTDGVTYFTQLRSLIFDRDLDVAAEFAFLNQPPRPNHVVPRGTAARRGFRSTCASPPRTWWVEQPDGRPRRPTPWVSGSACPTSARRCCRRCDRRRGAGGPSPASASRVPAQGGALHHVLVFAATPLDLVMVYEPSMTHAASFGFVALFVVCSARWVPQGATVRQSPILGTLIGLAFLARSQESLFALYPAALVLKRRAAHPRRACVRHRRLLVGPSSVRCRGFC